MLTHSLDGSAINRIFSKSRCWKWKARALWRTVTISSKIGPLSVPKWGNPAPRSKIFISKPKVIRTFAAARALRINFRICMCNYEKNYDLNLLRIKNILRILKKNLRDGNFDHFYIFNWISEIKGDTDDVHIIVFRRFE